MYKSNNKIYRSILCLLQNNYVLLICFYKNANNELHNLYGWRVTKLFIQRFVLAKALFFKLNIFLEHVKRVKICITLFVCKFTIIKLQQERLSKLTILDGPFLVEGLGSLIAFL